MSLRLRDGPQGQNRRPGKTSAAIANIEGDSNLGFRKGSNKSLDGLLDSVLKDGAASVTSTANQSKMTSPSGDDNMDTWTISDELKSQADESTVVSSVNNWPPVQTPSQIRATAPHALTGIAEDNQIDINAGFPNISNTKVDASPNNEAVEDDGVTLGTIETNRPIDQVFVYSSNSSSGTPQISPSPSLSSHRQRRQYRSGTRSTASSVRSRSRNSSASGSSSRLSGILDTLGLGAESDLESSYAGSSASGSKFKISHHHGRHWGNGSAGVNTPSSMYGRAALVLVMLMTIIYIQWNALEQEEGYIRQSGSNHYHRKHQNVRYPSSLKDDELGEGVDRPIHDDKLLERMHKDPYEIAQRNAKVPKTREGPENLMDRPGAKDDVEPPVDTLPDRADIEDTEVVKIPSDIQIGYAGTYTKDPNHENVPLLWYIPRSGGGMIKNICSECLGLTLASEVGGTVPSTGEKSLEVVSVGGHKYVNVDTTTEEGIKEAKSLRLSSSGLSQLIVSPRFRESASLFDSKKGRAFALFRHPVERAVSMFYFLQKHKVPAVDKMSIEDYAKSPHVENNWMVRILSGKMEEEVGEKELAIAKEVLRTKIVVGLLERKEESMMRFAHYFGWPVDQGGKQSACQSRILTGDYRTNESAKGKVKEGSQAWSLLLWQNKLDTKLYKYAKALYLQQGAELFTELPEGK